MPPDAAPYASSPRAGTPAAGVHVPAPASAPAPAPASAAALTGAAPAFHAPSYAGMAPLYHAAALHLPSAPHELAMHPHAVMMPHALAAAAAAGHPNVAEAHQLYQQQMQMMAASGAHNPYAFAAQPLAHHAMPHHFQAPSAAGVASNGVDARGAPHTAPDMAAAGNGVAAEKTHAGSRAPEVRQEHALKPPSEKLGGTRQKKIEGGPGVEKRRRKQSLPPEKLAPDVAASAATIVVPQHALHLPALAVLNPGAAHVHIPPPNPAAPSLSSMPLSVAFVNGRYVPMRDAQVSITDLGFTYGCAVVEDILLMSGVGVRMDAHLEYLATASTALNLPLPLSVPDLRSICAHIIALNRDVGIRGALHIQLSYGAYALRTRRLPPPSSIVPSLVIHTQPLPPIPPNYSDEGIALHPAHDDSPSLYVPGELPVPYKSSSQLQVLLALQTAIAHDCEEALLFEPLTGDVTGTTNGHIFCVKFGVVYTPPAVGKVSDCVMRRTILEACRGELQIEAREVSITQPFLCSATEVFCASVLDLVVPVRAVGDREIGDGVPGPVTLKVMTWISNQKAAPVGLKRPVSFTNARGQAKGFGRHADSSGSNWSRDQSSSGAGRNSAANSGGSEAVPAPPRSSSPNRSRESSDENTGNSDHDMHTRDSIVREAERS